MISQRQKDILWAVIEEHTKMAEPVSSKSLSQKSGFDIGAPMIRKEMNQLEKEGYLSSPHTSAGRIPTDKAYRLYIQENMVEKSTLNTSATGLTQKETQKVKESLKKNWPDEQSLLKEISKLTSELSRELSVTGTTDGGNTYSFGFSNLFDEPEFKSFENMNQLMTFMDNMDSCFEGLWNPVRSSRAAVHRTRDEIASATSNGVEEMIQVFIGSENPIKEINEFTLITGKYQLPEGEPFDSTQGKQGFVSIIGPKRMDYKHNMALVEYISELLNQKH